MQRQISLQRKDGTEFVWHVASFGALLNLCLEKSAEFVAVLRSLYQTQPCALGHGWQILFIATNARQVVRRHV